ncbi:MAG: hypothetical protein ACP5JO_01750 [Candidatus Ratteibacteria bacterium]
MNLIVYLRDRDFYFLQSDKKRVCGFFESDQDISEFLKENKISTLTLVFSRPSIFIRTLSFPFSSLKKISEVLPNELAPLFPVPVDALECFWYVVSKEKSKNTVSVLAVEKNKIEKWLKYRVSHKFKIRTCFEPFVLSNYVSRTTLLNTFLLIFVDGNYVAKYIVKNNVMIESSSSYFEPDAIDSAIADIINLNHEKLVVVCLGDVSAGKFQAARTINLRKGEELASLLFSVFESLPALNVSPPFNLYSIRRTEITLNPLIVVGVILYLAVASFMFRPYFVANQVQMKVNDLNRQMEETFKAAFPDVKKVVNPVIQVRERLRNVGEAQKLVPRISVISIMKAISSIVPENIPFKVSQMSVRGSDLFLACSTDTLENVESVSQCFKKVKMFDNLKVSGIMPGSDQISFNLLIKIKNDRN